MSGRVRVHLELRQGGARGALRVQREAELQFPSEGVKQLPMPLDFLCVEGSLPTACASGMTCRAGSCVDDKVERLADYVETPSSGACFNVAACFRGLNGNNTPAPREDDNFKRCVIRGNQVLHAVDVNVALIVNRTVVGNYGVCDALSGRCLVPLNQGPEGWQTLRDASGNAVAIGLPEAVCTGSEGMLGVVVSSSPNCATNTECQETPICVAADKQICPAPSWSGLSCSGPALPSDNPPSDHPYHWCGRVKADPATGPVVAGLWCCAEREPAQPNPLLIDDMSSGPLLKLEPEKGFASGAWFSASDDTNADLSPPPAPALFSYRAFDPAVVPAPGASPISHAACLRSDKGFSGYVAMEGFVFSLSMPDNKPAPLDVSHYTGIRFWAAAMPLQPGKLDVSRQLRVQFANVDTYDQPNSESTCLKEGKAETCDDFGKKIALPGDYSWASYTIKWDELEQQGYGQPFTDFKPNVYTTTFIVQGNTSRSLPFDFCVAQVEFTED
jgi:hypothetical protein